MSKITLAASSTLQAKAGTTSVINYTIHGLTRSGGVTTAFPGPIQGQLTGSIATIYTSTSVETIVSNMLFANTSGSNVTMNFYEVASGTTATSSNQVFQVTIPANGGVSYDDDGWNVYDSNGFRQYVGSTGPSGTIAVGTVTNIGTSGPPTVTNVGTSTAATFNFGLQQGATGSTGAPGAVNTVTAADTSVVVSGTTNVTVATNTVDVIATDHPAAADWSNNSHKITSVKDPTSAQDAATKAYVDATAQGLAIKESCDAATTGAETFTILTGNVTVIAGTVIDGYSPLVADRILIKDAPASTGTGSAFSTQPGNGIYAVVSNTTNLVLSRATDMAGSNGPAGAFTFVETGTVNGGGGFTVTTPTTNSGFTYGTNNIKWTQFSGAGEVTVDASLTKTGNQLSRAALTGDTTATGGSNATTVVKIQGQSISSTTPTVGQVLEYGPSSTWTPSNLFFNVVSFGADPTASSNSYTAIQNAINAAQIASYSGNSGAIVWFPPGRYLIGTTLSVTGHNITLMGTGGGQSADFGNYATPMASHIVPQSAIKAVVVSPVLTNGINGNPNFGFKWKGLGIDNYANAGTIGLQLISCQNFDVDDFYAINSTSVGLDMNTLPASFTNGALSFPLSAATITVNSTAASGTGPAFPANTNTAGTIIVTSGAGSTTPGQKIAVTYTGGSGTTFTGCSSAGLGTGTFATATSYVSILPGAQDTTRGHVGLVNFRQVDGGGASGTAIQLNGDSGGVGNTNLINWDGPVKIAHLNGIGINDINSDTNYYNTLIINRASGGSGIGAVVGAGTTNAFASRNNVFNHVSFGPGGLTARGTPTATFPSGPTRVMNYQLANGEAVPTVEAGALLDVNFNGAFKVGSLTSPSVSAQALTAATVNQLNNSKFVVPPNGFQVGTHLMWSIPLNKTGTVGTSWLFNIRYGTGAVSTGAILQTVTYTATAVADGGVLELHCIINALGSGTSATNVGYARLSHNLGLTGLATGVTTPASDATGPASFIYTRPTFAGFDSTLPNQGTPQFISVEINPVTASTAMNTQPGVQAFCLAQSNF